MRRLCDLLLIFGVIACVLGLCSALAAIAFAVSAHLAGSAAPSWVATAFGLSLEIAVAGLAAVIVGMLSWIIAMRPRP